MLTSESTTSSKDTNQQHYMYGTQMSDSSDYKDWERPHPETLMHAAVNTSAIHGIPFIMHKAPRSIGQALEVGMRAHVGSHFAHDFSSVRVQGQAPVRIQTKLKFNQPGDQYEREADRVAEKVMRSSTGQTSRDSGAPAGLQRSPNLSSTLGSLRDGQPLPVSLRTFFEPRFGVDLGSVQVHTGPQSSDLARSVNARAFTAGQDIVFGKGEYAPESTRGRHLLAHELTHVMQQNARVPRQSPSQKQMPVSSVSRQLAFSTELQGKPTIQRAHELNTSGVTNLRTTSGNFFRFGPRAARSNDTDRPRFIHPASAMTLYTDTGNNGFATVHPAVTSVLDNMVSALQGEGNRINDESMKQAVVASGYRPSEAREGVLYLNALKKTIRENPSIFSGLTFPTSLENMAKSELGTSGSLHHRAFVNALAGVPGWNRGLAQQLVDITGSFKAPRGGSTHHSGLVVDIDFPYAANATNVERHGMNREKNADARQAAAGVWLDTFSRNFDFDTYDTSKEIWHQEWRSWAGTTADPARAGAGPAAAPTGSTAMAPEESSANALSTIETEVPASEMAMAAPATGPQATAPAIGPGATPAAGSPTTDTLLNEWLAIHPDDHLSSDLSWILSQWPTGGSLNDLEPVFRASVQTLLNFVAPTPGASFHIISYARSPDKQHVMHVSQYIRKGWVGYNKFKFSLWPDLVAAGGRAAVASLDSAPRATKLNGVNNPEVLRIVWDTGTLASSKQDTEAIAGSTGYNIGITNPVANGGAAYVWPTGNTSTSLHGGGNAVDADPVQMPNEVVIRTSEAAAWPNLAAVQVEVGASNVSQVAATPATPTTPAQEAGYKIKGLSNTARRDAFFELFFNIRSAARAGFTDPNHFQAP
jgi:hypothetical protein